MELRGHYAIRKYRERVVIQLCVPELCFRQTVYSCKITSKPSRKINDVNALVKQFAAAGYFLIKSPLLFHSLASTMAVACANKKHFANPAAFEYFMRLHYARMKAMIETN